MIQPTYELGSNIAEFTECECGCNMLVADTPIEMLEFLLRRFSTCGVSDAVAKYYARDIQEVLRRYNVGLNEGKDLDVSIFEA